MKIGIIGVGFVGGTTAKILSKHHKIILYDKFKEPYTSPDKLINVDIIFICVPTPMSKSGKIDYSAIHNSIKTLEKIFKDKPKIKRPLIVIRSTAVSGTTSSLAQQYNFNFAFNPEFLRQDHALEDMKKANKVIIGVERDKDFQTIKKIYKPLLPKAKYIKTNTKTAEMIKYSANVILTGQIAMANEIYQICKSSGVNYNKVKDTILLDQRIGGNIDVPGPDGNLGFGGACFPKDLNALIYLARENNYRPYLLEEVWRLNQRVRKE